MIVRGRSFEGFLRSGLETLRAVLIHGEDEGLVRERARACLHAVVPDGDAMRLAELSERDLAGDPARLADEAHAIAMFGGRRAVLLEGAGVSAPKAVENLLALPAQPGAALIVVTAGALRKDAKLRTLMEKGEGTAAVPCYADSPAELEDLIVETLRAEDLRIAPGALQLLVGTLGQDRGLTRQELAKLALYCADAGVVGEEDVRACVSGLAEAGFDEVIGAAARGEPAALDRALARAFAQGVSPVGLLRGALHHFQRLSRLKAEMDAGRRLDDAFRALRPPAFDRQRSEMTAQLQRWSARQLDRALMLIDDTEAQCKTTGIPAEAAAGRCFLALARVAAGR